jgi:hypothetical protein
VDSSTVPSDAIGILSKTDTDQWVAYAYPYGEGIVIYSSIPLNHYLGGSGSAAFRDIYAPNIIAYAGEFLSVDTDGDGVPDYDEVILGLDFADPDTDGDGLNDGFEIKYEFDPLVPGEESLDVDSDGLTNLQEQQAGSNPHVVDTDGDGLPDADEVNLYHSDPTMQDGDRDGLSDVQEIGYGTDPLSRGTAWTIIGKSSTRIRIR